MKNENLVDTQHFGEGRILIVEPEQDAALELKGLLEPLGYQVEAVYSAEDSFETLTAFDAEVALIGICPEDTGEIDLLARFKVVRPRMLCVMITECKQTEKVIAGLERGAYDVVPKPVNPRYLLTVLKRCFEKLRLEQQKVYIEDTLNLRNRELQEVNDRLKTIARSTRSLTTCTDIEEINRRLLEEFARNMAAEGGSLYLVKQDALVLAHTLDPGHAPRRIAFPLREGTVFERILREKQPVLVRDIEQEEGLLKSGWTGYRNGALLVFPLAGGNGDIQGVLTLHNRTYPPFTSQDREIGTILASYSYEVLRATHALEQLQISEERYRRIFDNIQDVYYETLLDGEIIEVSPSVASISGYTREELLNRSVWVLYANPDERVGLLELLKHQGKVTDYEIHLQDKKGRVTPCSLTSRLLFDEHGTPWKICGTLRDITERKQAEQQLQEQKALLDEIFHGVQEGIGIVDEHEVILFCNPAYADIFDLTPDQLIGKSLLTLFDAEVNTIILQQTRDRQAGKISTYELPLATVTGAQKYVRVTVSPRFRSDGVYAGAFGALLDVTERKRAEQEIQQLNVELEARVRQRTAELERANQELRHFVHAASHDLKTPLYGISRLASWLNEDYGGALGEEGQARILRIINRVNRLDMLIEGMLEYSRIRRAPLKLETIDLNLLVRNVIQTLAPPEHIHILIEKPLPVILGNTLHLRQVFSHLLDNAITFMDKPEGKVTISWSEDDRYWQFAITDNGRGIEQKYYARIFQIFQTLQRRDEHESSGIGLALVKKVVELHDGKVWVESIAGQGSTFFFTLLKMEDSPMKSHTHDKNIDEFVLIL